MKSVFRFTSKILLMSIVLIFTSGFFHSLEDKKFNVYFYYPNGRELHLGVVKGLSACQDSAWAKAQSLRMQNANWSYICCLKTRSSECKSKHK